MEQKIKLIREEGLNYLKTNKGIVVFSLREALRFANHIEDIALDLREWVEDEFVIKED
jgi:hypothetical protein